MQFDSVKTKPFGVTGRTPECCNRIGDIGVVHRFGDRLAIERQAGGHVHRCGTVARVAAENSAGMPELRRDSAAGTMNGFDDIRPAIKSGAIEVGNVGLVF